MRHLRLLRVVGLVLIGFIACIDFGGDDDQSCGPAPNKCIGVVCEGDGNECTRDCNPATGTCDYMPFSDGKDCDDRNDSECADDVCIDGECTGDGAWKVNGTRCTFAGTAGVCVAGVCGENLCEGVDCDDEPCSTGRCDYVDGLCDYTPTLPNGETCVYDGLEGVCVNGLCGENLCEGVDCDDDDACTHGTCDYVDGTCDFAPVVCDDDNECTDDTCNPTIGCEHAAAANGTPCRGGVLTCQDGNCAGYAQDFESLHRASPTALSDDGWLIFGCHRPG